MKEGKRVPKDILLERNKNTFITAGLLDIPDGTSTRQVPRTMALMPPQPVIYYVGT